MYRKRERKYKIKEIFKMNHLLRKIDSKIYNKHTELQTYKQKYFSGLS